MGPAPEVMYVAYGATYVQEAMGYNVTDYIITAPSGWLVEDEIVYAEAGNLQLGLNITAPKSAAIDNGMALAGGYIKVLAMLEGGKQVTSKMLVTTEAFQTFSAANGTVSLIPTYGNLKHFYGIAEKDSFDPAAIEATIIAEEEADPYGYGDRTYMYAENNGWSSDGSVNVSVADLLQTAEYGKTYVLWSMPSAMINYSYVFTPGTLVSKEFVHQSIEQDEESVKVTFNSISTKIAFNGVSEVYGGASLYFDELPMADDVLSNINSMLAMGYSDYITKYPTPETGVFEGNPVAFFGEDATVSPSTNYYVWFVIPQEGKTKYTAADLIMYTYSTPAPVAGGSLAVTMTANEVTGTDKYKKISVNLASEGAEMIYYKFIEREDLSLIADKAAYLLEEGSIISKDDMTTPVEDNNLVPETYRYLLAMAVDAEGKYGEVAAQMFSTPKYEFNSLNVSVALAGDAIKGYNKFTVTPVEGAVEYRYVFYKTDSYNWTNTLGGSVETAELKIATGTSSSKATLDDNNQFQAFANSYGDWILLVFAKDEYGVLSKAAVLNVKVMFNLGTFVAAKDQNGNENADWAAKKPTVTFKTEAVGDFTTLSWSVSGLAEGFTAQTVSVHDDYLVEYPTGKDKANFFLTTDVLSLEAVLATEDAHSNFYASAGYNIWVIIKDADGNYYEPYKYECNITGGFGQ